MTDSDKGNKRAPGSQMDSAALSELYRQVRSDGPDKATDSVILSAANREVEGRSGKPGLRQKHWALPVAIAAMLIVSFALIWQQRTEIAVPENHKQSAAPPYTHDRVPQVEERNLDHPAPEQWLEAILALHLAGNQTQAAIELTNFRQVYPEYPMTDKRFEPLHDYDK